MKISNRIIIFSFLALLATVIPSNAAIKLKSTESRRKTKRAVLEILKIAGAATAGIYTGKAMFTIFNNESVDNFIARKQSITIRNREELSNHWRAIALKPEERARADMRLLAEAGRASMAIEGLSYRQIEANKTSEALSSGFGCGLLTAGLTYIISSWIIDNV